MEFSIQEILKQRIEAYQNNTLEQHFILEGKEYQKKWANAVQFFQKEINKERAKDKLQPLTFIAIRQKLCHIKEIDDLRWFYKQCLKYQRRRNTAGVRVGSFSKCFFGALKIK